MVVDYRLNTPSFSSLSWQGTPPTNIERTISYAFQHWTAYAGSRRTYRFIGETNLTGWQVTQPIIVAARAGCEPRGCSISGHMIPDQELIFWQMGTNPPLWSAATGVLSLSGVAVHEIGHDVLRGLGQDDGGHVSNVFDAGAGAPTGNERCVMGASVYPGDIMGFCEREVLLVGRDNSAAQERLVGPGYNNWGVVESITSSFNPSILPPAANTLVTPGIAGSVLVHGTNVFNPSSEFRLIGGTKVSWLASSIPPVAVSPSDASWEATPIPSSIQRPATAFDPTRHTLWTAVRVATALTSKIKLYRNVLGTPGWEDMGIMTHPSRPIESRYPPGLAFDHRTGNLVVTWTSSAGSNTFSGGCNQGPEFQCRSEVLAAIVVPGTSSAPVAFVRRFVLGPLSNLGYSAVGTPSVICDPDLPLTNNQCEVYAVNRTQWKEIVSWRFCVDSTGFCGFSLPYSERANSPGETDYPIAVAGRRGDGSGRIVQVVVGTDRNLYWRTKASVGASFPGWNGPVTPRAMGAASVINSQISSSFTVIWPNENQP